MSIFASPAERRKEMTDWWRFCGRRAPAEVEAGLATSLGEDGYWLNNDVSTILFDKDACVAAAKAGNEAAQVKLVRYATWKLKNL